MSSHPLRVAVVGAGPSGFYTAEALIKGRDAVEVDLIDRLPTPYGLVRYGVAPDHQKIKSVTRMYERTCGDSRVRFLGNVAYGRDLHLDDLQRHYHAVVFAVGAASDRNLGIPGEALAGSLSATEFVAWYNGHPDYVDLTPDLSGGSVAVIGMGNVAVDVVRILAKSTEELAETDIAVHALDHLASSRVEDVYMIGRRGPAQGKFTTKELRELGELAHADIVVDPTQLDLDPASERALEGDRAQTRNVEILRSFAAKPLEGKPRRVHMRFLASPVELIGAESVQSVRLERNTLDERDGGYLAAVGTGAFDEIPAQMVLRSVGYRGVALDGVPFDQRRGVVPNVLGRVLDAPDGNAVPGLYVAGWIKRGPSGVIGTNKADAMETVAQLLDDQPEGAMEPHGSAEAVDALLSERGVRTFDFEAWRRLDAAEVAAGEALGRPRVKVVDVAEMLVHAEP
jgi:ferredoxin--NADP+ reductase